MTRSRLLALFVALTMTGGVPVVPAHAADVSATSAREREQGDYRIGPDDTLQISVWKNDAMSRIVPVRPDGMVSLPLLNDVQAAGRTPMQLRDILIKKLSEYMPNPEVSVVVTEVRSFKISVIGEVNKAGRYELKTSTTVLDALALAGGFTQFAARQRIVVLRQNGKGVTRLPFTYNKVIATEQENFDLQPGDIVVVP